jgi:predicted nucleic acid-binding protein
MTSFLLDTNVLSETTQRSPNEKAVSWLRTVPLLLIPAVAVYEIALGIKQLPLGKKRMFLEAWLDELLEPNAEVIPLDHAAALASAEVAALARSQGRNIDHRDLMILGMARARGLTIATRNEADFCGLLVPVYNPFDDRYHS